MISQQLYFTVTTLHVSDHFIDHEVYTGLKFTGQYNSLCNISVSIP